MKIEDFHIFFFFSRNLPKIEDFHFSDSSENINYHCTYPKCIAVVSFRLVRDFGINHMIVRSKHCTNGL